MSRAVRMWPLLTGMQRYEKTVSTRGRGRGEFIEAPILAYLIETPNGRILYDVGCDYAKIADPARCAAAFEPMRPVFEAPRMHDGQRIPRYLERLGLRVSDVDLVFLGHLHFDHAGGCGDLAGCEVHVHRDELAAARSGRDGGVFADEISGADAWVQHDGEHDVAPGVQALATPGHTAGHMSLLVELPHGRPVVICGDAADLDENLRDEVPPGNCWQDDTAAAVASIRKLKELARAENAELWPNHDLAFFNRLAPFPRWRD